jgi:hypothetical protein
MKILAVIFFALTISAAATYDITAGWHAMHLRRPPPAAAAVRVTVT